MEITLLIVILLAVFTPGNTKINEYCSHALEGNTSETFENRAECWNYYHEYRDEIPEI